MSDNMIDIALTDIHADEEFNCRGRIAPIDVVELSKDIERNGLIQPVVVCEYDEENYKETGRRYRLLCGFRRFTAHIVLGREKIKAIVREQMTEDSARLFNLAENIQRQALNIWQEAKAVERLRSIGTHKDDIAKRLGVSPGWVQIRCCILEFPNDVQQEIAKEIFTQPQIRELYTALHRKGLDACYALARTFKEAKAKGEKAVTTKFKDRDPNTKRLRRRPEIFEMMGHIQHYFGNGVATKCMSWCAGEISDIELIAVLEEYAKRLNVTYIKPTFDQLPR